MELINNTTKTLKDDLSVEIKQGSKLSIAAACFSIYAFQELKEQLSQIEELRFIFTSPTFVTEKAKKERREFYIPRLTRERSLYGTEFEIKLRNELTQKAIARECAEWIRQKVTFKSNVSDKSIQGQIVVDSVGYTPINNFTTVELGCEKGNVISTTIVKDESLARTLLADFNEIWNDSKVLQVVTDEVIDSITAAYNENSPDFIYFVTLYNIFNEFLEDVSEDVLPNEATGFKESKIWGMLYNFQKDAALAIIFSTIPLRANMTAPSSRLKRQRRALIRLSLQRKPFRTMCSRTALPTRALKESLLRIWTQQTRCVSMPSCREPSKFLRRWATIRRTGQSLSTKVRLSTFSL